jgi:Xaa-Pro aminopeptidase
MRFGPVRRVTAACIGFLIAAAYAGASEFSDDLAARRSRVMEKLGTDAMLVLWSAPPQRYSLDVDYEYRQDSNLYYLTGLTQEDTILVLMPGNAKRREILFIKDRNPAREHWTGRLLSAAEASERTGIETVLTTSQFDTFAAAMLDRRPFGVVDEKESPKFFAALAEGRAQVKVVLNPGRGLNEPLSKALEFARQIRDRFFGFQVGDAASLLTEQRTVKTPYERGVLIRDLEISSDAQLAGMRSARPGAFEYEVKAAIEAVFRGRGAVSWSYPSIVGSGPNATILHYEKSSRKMEPGDLLLVDAAANYQGLTGDITRTYPVDGKFSPEQRDIYGIVFAAQQAGEKAAKIGGQARDIQAACDDVLRAGLVRLGLVTDPAGMQFKIWATHGVTHWIGMDVHDVGVPRRPLDAGMAFTIEPGIYIREAALNDLPKTPENAAFIEKVRPMVAKYRNLGVRIEDSYLLTSAGLERLSKSVPRTIDEIEAFLKK